MWRAIFHVLSVLGRPFGGVRPRRVYDMVGRRGWRQPEYRWRRNCWGDELYLSPHQHLDRCVLAFGCYDPELHRALERLVTPGMICLDVGANFGELALHMARKAQPGGVVHAFEPASGPFARLREHVARNGRQVVCHRLALADHSGQMTMSVPTAAADNQGLGTLAAAHVPSGYATETVGVQTLDAFVEEQQLPRVDFIKLDIQGGEPLLVQGGMKTLRRFGPLIVTEFSPGDLVRMGYDSRRYAELLGGLGYGARQLTARGVGAVIGEMAADFAATNVVFVREKR